MRKVLSFVLVLSLVLGSFSMAFAADSKSGLSDVAGIANEEAITVNVNLGIIDGYPDGTFGPEKVVNRAEFAKMITKAMGIPESALAGYTKVSFKDTTGYGWAVPYLAFCESKGIINGYGDGTVRPGNTITVNEAMTMVLRAIGYTANSADLVGAWPANYVTLAQKNSLYDKVAATVTADRASAAQIIYNVLTVQTVSVATDGKTDVSGKSLLENGLDCYADTFVINGDEETLINLKSYVGKECKVFMQKAKPNAIVAIAKEESSAVTGEFNDEITITAIGAPTDAALIVGPATKLVDADDVEYTFSDVVPNLFINGESQSLRAIDKEITSDTSVTVYGDIRGKKIVSINSLNVWDLTQGSHSLATKGDLAQIDDDMLLGGEFATLKNGDIDTNSFDLVGVKSLSDIKVDNVVYVYWKANDTISKIEVGTEVVEGKVTAINGGKTKFTVDGKAYEFASQKAGSSVTPNAGDEVKFFLDVNGDIYKSEVTSGKTDKYAVLVDKFATKDEVKLYTSDDEDVWFNYTSKANAVAGFDAGQLVGYALDSNGKIKAVTLGAAYATVNDGLVNVTVKSPSIVIINSVSYKVDSKAVVFTADLSAGLTPNGITTMNNVDIATISGSALLNDKGDTVLALLVDDSKASRTVDDVYGVINTIEYTTNDDGDADQTIKGFVGADTLDKKTTEELIDPIAYAALYQFKYNGDGLIKDFVEITTSAAKVEVVYATVDAVNSDVAVKIVSGGGTEWAAVAKDAVVYKASIKDGEVDKYTKSSMDGINKEYAVMLIDVDNTDDSVAKAGYDFVIYMTKADFAKYVGHNGLGQW